MKKTKKFLFFMINTIDDLIQILRDNHDKHEEVTVAHLNADLTEPVFFFKKSGISL